MSPPAGGSRRRSSSASPTAMSMGRTSAGSRPPTLAALRNGRKMPCSSNGSNTVPSSAGSPPSATRAKSWPPGRVPWPRPRATWAKPSACGAASSPSRRAKSGNSTAVSKPSDWIAAKPRSAAMRPSSSRWMPRFPPSRPPMTRSRRAWRTFGRSPEPGLFPCQRPMARSRSCPWPPWSGWCPPTT